MTNLYRPDNYGGLGYSDYNRYMRRDGMVCRHDGDCTWLDRNMGCDDRSLAYQPLTVIIIESIIVGLVLLFLEAYRELHIQMYGIVLGELAFQIRYCRKVRMQSWICTVHWR